MNNLTVFYGGFWGIKNEFKKKRLKLPAAIDANITCYMTKGTSLCP
jgi:hypothetical protein